MRTFSLGFFLGTLSLLLLPDLPSRMLIYSMTLGLGIAVGLITYHFATYFWVRFFSILSLSVLLGNSYALLSAHQIKDHWLTPEQEGRDLTLTGVIVDIPEQRSDSTSFVLQANSPALQGRFSLTWYADKTTTPPKLKAGEQWQLVVRCKRPNGFSNPHGFDYEKWLFTQRIVGVGYVRPSVTNQRLAATPQWSVANSRQYIKEQIDQALDNSPAKGLVQGLAIAYTQAISPVQWDLLRQTGTVHLLAISGLHITMVAGLGLLPVMFFWWCWPRLALWLPLRIAAGSIGGLLAIGYACLAGLNIPTQRTLIMLLVMLLGLVWRRAIAFSSAFSFALLLVLLVDPLASLAVGFWLSFITVGLLVYLGKRRHKLSKFNAIHLQFMLSIGTIPLIAGFFGMISLVSPLANFIAIPLVTFVVTPLILLGIGVMGWYPLAATKLWQVSAWLLDWLMQGLHGLVTWPLANVYVPAIPSGWLVLALVGWLFLYLPRGSPGRWLGIVAVLPLLYYQAPRPALGEFTLNVLDVGQGLASVVQTAQHTLVFDTGPKTSSTFDTGELVVLPWLRGQGIKQIDRLLISHADNDHSGGAEALIKQLVVRSIVVSDQATLPELVNKALCQAGQQWQWDGVSFSVLHPSADFTVTDENNRACVVKVSNGFYSVLLTADIEQEAEAWLSHSGLNIQADVLLVPHHGSKTSSSLEFIQAVKPQLAIITSGYRNRFQHPHEIVLNRYAQQHIRVVNTVDTGAFSVSFPLAPTVWREEGWRLTHASMWQK